MAELLTMVPSMEETGIHDYPPEKRYLFSGFSVSFGIHCAIVGIIALMAYLHHIRSLRDMMTATVVQLPPDQLEILLIDEKKEPPPTTNPLWIKQLIIPKVKPPPPPPPPKPKPKPQPVRLVQHITVGAHGLPTPEYPIEAYRDHVEGTVELEVAFDASGGVSSAEVTSSSGSAILDNGAKHYVLANWHSDYFAGTVQTVPIQYVIPK
jgi:TonB family protein